jgi:transcriptional regulator with XRE-family HTH domain
VVEKHEAKITDKLGEILKRERIKAGYTREQTAERVGIGVRHLAAIENEQRKPSAEVMCRLVRAIGISADLIIYPTSIPSEPEDTHEIAQLIRLIRICNKRTRRAAKAMLEVLCYGSQPEEDE